MEGQADQGPTYIQQLTAEINGINACGALQALVNEAMATIQGEIDSIESQIAALLPIQVLLQIPGANLQALAKWISNYINNVLAPQFAPYFKYLIQLEQTVQQLAELTQAIQAAAARLTSCSIAIQAPVITVPLPSVTVVTS